jgi:hypothetical protein
MTIYLLAFFVPLVHVFLRVFQQRNVANKEVFLMALTSYGITAFDILSVTIIVSKGWEIYLPLATGGALGSIAAVYFYEYLVTKRAKNEDTDKDK